jgi:hypothetical protein
MRSYSSFSAGLCFCLLASLHVLAQDPAYVDPADPKTSADQTESLADHARKLRSNKPQEVQTTQQDAQKLFRSVDEILAFASKDSGFPIRHTVKRRLVSRADVEKETRDQMTKADVASRFSHSELTMKKLGLLPHDFNVEEFVVNARGQDVAGYYDPNTKVISLVNWISLDELYPVMAHELTHALQDQNYELDKWAEAGRAKGADKSDDAPDESVLARHAVAEGQAMLVFVDFMLAPHGRNVRNTPGVLASMEEPAVKASIDTEWLHKAPMIMREAGTFPYREGMIFEGELLQAGGQKMAFEGAFLKPPRNSHEVLHPRAYIGKESVPAVHIPDMKATLAGKYEVYDSGSVGELDVRALLKQYGERRIADQLSANWHGGRYISFKKAQSPAAPTTADLAILYVSHWTSERASEQFAHAYAGAVAGRYQHPTTPASPSCTGASCPVWRAEIDTEEGPVIVEQWPENTVIISESFDQPTAAQLRDAVLTSDKAVHAESRPEDEDLQPELSSRFQSLAAFGELEADLGKRILKIIPTRIGH